MQMVEIIFATLFGLAMALGLVTFIFALTPIILGA